MQAVRQEMYLPDSPGWTAAIYNYRDEKTSNLLHTYFTIFIYYHNVRSISQHLGRLFPSRKYPQNQHSSNSILGHSPQIRLQRALHHYPRSNPAFSKQQTPNSPYLREFVTSQQHPPPQRWHGVDKHRNGRTRARRKDHMRVARVGERRYSYSSRLRAVFPHARARCSVSRDRDGEIVL